VDGLAGRLRELGDDVTVASIERVALSDVDPAACDVMGVAFPVHASSAPSLMQDFLAGLRPAAGKPLFGVTTAGYASRDKARQAVQSVSTISRSGGQAVPVRERLTVSDHSSGRWKSRILPADGSQRVRDPRRQRRRRSAVTPCWR